MKRVILTSLVKMTLFFAFLTFLTYFQFTVWEMVGVFPLWVIAAIPLSASIADWWLEPRNA